MDEMDELTQKIKAAEEFIGGLTGMSNRRFVFSGQWIDTNEEPEPSSIQIIITAATESEAVSFFSAAITAEALKFLNFTMAEEESS